VKARITRDKYRQLVFDGQITVAVKFETDKDLIEMRKFYSNVYFFAVYHVVGVL